MVALVPTPEAPDLLSWFEQYPECVYVVARQDGSLLSGTPHRSAVETALRMHEEDGEDLPLYGWRLAPSETSDGVRPQQIVAIVRDQYDRPTLVGAEGGFRS